MKEEKEIAGPKEPLPADAEPSGTESRTEPSTADGNLPADLPGAYRKLLAEKRELYDRLLRSHAELENSRKRWQREKEDFLQHATADLMRALLPVLDGFERALKHRDAGASEDYYHGLDLIYRQFLGALRRAGLTEIETQGKTFDPHVHQAVETVEAQHHRDQEIVEELQRGYRLKHRLLRPAIVKVAVHGAKKPPATPAEEENA